MKKVINGSLYNTDTANCIGSWSNNLPYNDFGWCEESLYRTKSGKYFLHGEGGAMSIYCVHSGNSTSGGEMIKPLSLPEASQWAEECLSGEEYIAEFHAVGEDGTDLYDMHIQLPREAKERLDEMKERSGKAYVQIITELILKGRGV
jgi:hypothetical protein